MPRDFRDFVKQNEKTSEQAQNQTQNYENILNKYKDMDKNSLIQNLFSEANRLKKEGKLNAETLNNLKTTLAPFLNNEQQQMLNQLIDALNE